MGSPLTVLQDRPNTIRRSRSAKWRAGVLIAIHLVIAAHIAHWLVAGRTVTPVEPSEAMAFSKAGVVNAGLIFFAATILLTAVLGRWFCGWACHLVALQDLCRWLLEKVGIRPRPLRSRVLAWVPALAFAYMFLWPVAYRLWIGDPFRSHGVELTTAEFWSTFPGWAIGGLTFLLCGFVIIYFLGAKGFCTYACPYGAIFGAVDRLAPMRIRVTDACSGCGHCTAVCTSNVRVHEEVRDWGMVVDSGCMKCRDCVSVCPNDALYYGFGPIPLVAAPRPGREESAAASRRRRYPLARWEEAVLAAGFVAAFFTFRGLYGAVPFLMSLGLAAILAFLVLLAVRLAVRPNLAPKRFPFKRAGRLTPAGWGFVGAMALVAVFWIHSAAVHASAALGGRGYDRLAAVRAAALDLDAEPIPSRAADRAAVRRTLARFERARDWGLAEPPGLSTRLAWLYLLDGSGRELRQAAAAGLARGEDPARLYALVGRDAAARGDFGTAVAAYREALAASPGEPARWVDLGIALARSGDLAAAEETFERGSRRVPDSAALVYNAGLAIAFQGRIEEAIARMERALELDPSYLEARENLAGLLAQAGRYEESVVNYRRALEQVPGDAETRFLLARALAAAGRSEAAAEELRAALRIAPGDPEAERLLAELETAQGQGGRGTTR
jgi:polyferredoxin/tetratricopeptide (TPR) repeat protein